MIQGVAPLLWPSVGVKPNTWKKSDLESFGTPECLELDSKGQNISHWGVLGVIGKVLKRRYRKCPRIDNSDICSPSYGQKKDRESMPSRHPNRECDMALEISREGYNFGSDLVAIQLCNQALWRFKVPGVPPGNGAPGICAIWMPSPWRAAENTIGSKVVAYSRVRAVVSLVCPSARGKSQHQRVSRGWFLDADSSLIF